MNGEMFRLRHSTQMMADGETAEIMLYGEIIFDTPENWKWSKEDKSAADFDKAVKQIKADGAKNALLRINSPGGYVTEAVAMRAILANAGFEKIDIRIEGLCASAATLLATIPGARVTITPGSQYMIHNPHDRCIGTASDMEKMAEALRQDEEYARTIYAKRCGKSDEEIKAWMDEEKWFTAKGAVDAGFCDAVAEEGGNSGKAAACVSKRMMTAMRAMYDHIPDCIETSEADNDPISNAPPASAAGGATEHNEHEEEENDMDIQNLTNEELLAGNPTLHASVMQAGAQAERQRMEDIDALTPAGYEQLAAEAKKNGTSAMDFHKAIVAAQKEKGAQFMNGRKQETAPAAKVTGGAAEMSGGEDDIAANAREIAELAKLANYGENGMF